MLDTSASDFKLAIANRRVLIADTSSTARAAIFQVLKDLGAKTPQIALASSYQAALIEIQKSRPELVFSEFQLGSHSGLELAKVQREKCGHSKDTVFICLTTNTSHSAVARAAEEDIDAYVLKPFRPEALKKVLIKAFLLKINPPPYVKAIDAGKAAMDSGNIELAEKWFLEAMNLDPKPSLACFYLGEIRRLTQGMQDLEVAQNFYAKGLNFNTIHYKCLLGLYETAMQMKQHEVAYEMSKKLSLHYPANPKRLAEAIRLAVVNQQFQDIEKYHTIFTNLDQRDETLVTHVCAALVVTGKFHLKNQDTEKALEAMSKAAISCAGNPKILKQVVQTLIDFKLAADAERFLKRYPVALVQTEEYLLLDFQITDLICDAVTVLNKGRKLLQQGFVSEKFFEILVARAVEGKFVHAAEGIFQAAITRYPESRTKFEGIFRPLKSVSASQLGQTISPS